MKSRAALTTADAAELRASEVVSLKVPDIDSGRMVTRVEQGKGGRDRYVMMSPKPLAIVRSQWRLARHGLRLLEKRNGEHPINPTALHDAFRSA